MDKPIRHIKQQTDFSCVIACIAMVAGTSFKAVAKYAPTYRGLSNRERDVLLVRFGILPVRRFSEELKPSTLYIVAVPSLNLKGKTHAVVLDYRKEYKVWDPQMGREGKNFYTIKNLKAWNDPCECIDALNFNILRH